jgi:hypothetical protein
VGADATATGRARNTGKRSGIRSVETVPESRSMRTSIVHLGLFLAFSVRLHKTAYARLWLSAPRPGMDCSCSR